MKKSLVLIGICAALGMAPKAQAIVSRPIVKKAKVPGHRVPEAVPGEFVVKMRRNASDFTALSLDSLMAPLGMSVKSAVNLQEGLFLTRVVNPAKMNLVSAMGVESLRAVAIARIQKLPGVEYAEPNFIYHSYGDPVVPNDPRFNDLWGMKNIGQTDDQGKEGKRDADIGATRAWSIGTGSKDIVVAVIDTGVDYTHPDLKENIWSSPENPKIHGHNAVEDAKNADDPMDDNSHGSHCSGTIGAKGNNGVGIAGVNWNVSIMGVKFLSAQGSGTLADAVKAIDWAVDHNARILSNSWGGGGFAQSLFDSIKRAADKNILFVAAAGNDAGNNDANPEYPSGYELPNIVAVAASTNGDVLAEFSNYGANTVHLMAPGDGILSTVPGNDYKVYSGTSMACPHVSGAAALLLSREPNLTPVQVKERLMSSSDKLINVRRKLASGGRLNIYNLLAGITPPGFVTVPDSAWSALVPQTISTEHPYGMGAHHVWTIEQPGATYMRIHFAKFKTEKGYDVLTVKNGNDEIIDTYSDEMADNTWSGDVNGSKIVLEFNSDDSVDDYGFDIDGFSWTNYTGQ